MDESAHGKMSAIRTIFNKNAFIGTATPAPALLLKQDANRAALRPARLDPNQSVSVSLRAQ
jgi:hypothetical protein